MSRALQAVREAAVDGRLQNVIYRQTQLEKLQKVLLENVEPIESAIGIDSGHSDGEAAVEYILTLQGLKDYYDALDERAALECEYALARGKDTPGRRKPVGIVYIVPATYTPFYSVIVAVSAAIAAGNCVVIEFENTLKKGPVLLRKLLKVALDPSIVGFVTTRATDEDLGQNYIRIFQDGASVLEQQSLSPNEHSPVLARPEARVVAVVDRSADLVRAATALVAARFGFGGNSPYAPDVVLVDEFVKKAFLVSVVEELVKYTANPGVVKAIDAERAKQVENQLETGRKNGDVEVVSSMSKGSVFEIKARNSEILHNRMSGTNLVLHGIRSLDDAINIANRTGGSLASYIFAAPASAKYLSQFIESQTSFVNHAPLEFLVGPAAPYSSFTDRSLRYPLDLLSVSHTEYIAPSPKSEFVLGSLQNTNSTVIAEALKEASIRLAPKKKRSTGGQIGFFEQAIIAGLGVFGVPTLLSVGILGYFGVRFALRPRS